MNRVRVSAEAPRSLLKTMDQLIVNRQNICHLEFHEPGKEKWEHWGMYNSFMEAKAALEGWQEDYPQYSWRIKEDWEYSPTEEAADLKSAK